MVNEKAQRAKLVGDVDVLVDEVDKAVREAVSEDRLVEDVETLVERVNRAVRDAVSDEKLVEDVETLVERVNRAVREAVSDEKPAENIETLVDKVTKVVRSAFTSGSEAAELVGQSLRDRIQIMLEGVRGTGRNSVVMVRVNKDSRDRMDELIEAELVSSRSEAAALLIAEGIKARQDLFNRISAKIEDIRKAKAELQRLLNEADTLQS